MVRRKTEGDESQRRAGARQARGRGRLPSAGQETTGASKQRRHTRRAQPHGTRMRARHQGKQQDERMPTRPHSR